PSRRRWRCVTTICVCTTSASIWTLRRIYPSSPPIHQLQQVFLNMVNNAVDAILEHSSEGDLWVRTGLNGDRFSIEFTDSGPGVKDASRVFDPFYTTKPVGKGTGLGLSICYGIITEHGGIIRVRNIPARGASFTIELPRQPEASPAPFTPWQSTILGRDG